MQSASALLIDGPLPKCSLHSAMKPKILVVDDEPDALELLGFNLQRAGFDVMTAADGAERCAKPANPSPA